MAGKLAEVRLVASLSLPFPLTTRHAKCLKLSQCRFIESRIDPAIFAVLVNRGWEPSKAVERVL
jgi:hypothetical protein